MLILYTGISTKNDPVKSTVRKGIEFLLQTKLILPISLKYQRFTPSSCKDIGMQKFEFVSMT